MKTKDKIILASLIVILFSCSIYLIRSILAPFLISFLLAYFLDPIVDRVCHKFKVSRLTASLGIVVLFFIIIIVASIFILPIIYEQINELIIALPQYGRMFVHEIYPQIVVKFDEIGIRIPADLSQVIERQDTETMLGFLQNFIINLFTSAAAVINVLSLIFIMPILVFYLLKDWDILVEKFHSYLPKKFAAQTMKIMGEVDIALSGYIRGQVNVCLILAFIYSLLLSLTGLDFGVLIGVLTGIFTFIPYVGALGGFIAAIFASFFQWGFDWLSIAPVIVVFLFCQTLETNYLTPKLVGTKVGLHPVWIIFGLFVFGVLFGFIGVMLATPLTAICGVLIKHLALEYKKRIS